MKRSDKYPPGTEEDARSLPSQTSFMGLHPLVWGMIAVFFLAGVGMYAEMVGFYEIDDFGEMVIGEEHDDDDDDDDDEESDDQEADDSEDSSLFNSPDKPAETSPPESDD